MAEKIGQNIPQDKMKLYAKLLATHPQIELKGKNNPYTSHNGHMFTFIRHDGAVALRLPKDKREEFLQKYNTTLIETYNTIMKEYVQVPDSLLPDTDSLREYLIMSFEYIKTLKPKPTKKK